MLVGQSPERAPLKPSLFSVRMRWAMLGRQTEGKPHQESFDSMTTAGIKPSSIGVNHPQCSSDTAG